MKQFIVLLLHFIFITTLSLSAQTGTIKGRVFDKKNNEPLGYATVQIEGTTIGTLTDVEGNFSLKNVEPQFCRLEVNFVGYEKTVSSEIQVQGNQTTFIDIAVKSSVKRLKTVVVRKKMNAKMIESPLSVLQVSVSDIEKTAGVNRDVSKLAQTLPGVGITDPNRNDLIVRGGSATENKFYLDEVEIPIINHFTTQGSSGGAVGVINPDFVRDLNFYTGAFPADRPNALSSVMEINLRDGNRDRLHTKVSVGASDAGITLEGPIGKKSTLIVSARQSYLQFLFSIIGLPFLPNYNDFQLKYKLELNKKNHLTVIGLGALDKMRLNTELENPSDGQRYLINYLPEFNQWAYTIGLVYKHFGDTYYDTWVLSRNMLRNQNYKYPVNNKNLPRIFDYHSDESENKFRFERNMPDGLFQTRWGVGGKHARYVVNSMKKQYANNAITTTHYDTNIHLFFYEAFIQLSKELLANRLKVSLGVNTVGNNFNNNMLNAINQLSPRLSATYSLTEQLNINMNVGRYVAPPAYTTFGFKDKNGILVNQNEKLKYIVSQQAVAGLEWLPNDRLRLTAEGFYKGYEHYPFSVAEGITTASKGVDYGQTGDEEIVSIGKGRAYGVEFLLKMMNWHNLNLSATYTLFKSEFTDKNNKYIPSTWDTGSLLNLIGAYKLNKTWNIALRWRWLGGAPYSPIDMEKSSLIKAWDVKNQPYINYEQFNSLRLSPSHQLDVRIDKEFYFKKWVLNVYADVQNVYNFQTQSEPIYTNLNEQGLPARDDNEPLLRYKLRKIRYYSGTILPTIGISVKL